MRLNTQQHSVVMQLGDVPVVLGCAETVAFRLCRAAKTRPAMCRHVGGGAFVLTEAGFAYRDMQDRAAEA